MTQEVLRLALEALELEEAQTHYPSQSTLKAITAIKEALAQHTWVGLSEQDINELKFNLPDLYYWVDVVRATEKRLKEKNT